jgi:hypothetical protein
LIQPDMETISRVCQGKNWEHTKNHHVIVLFQEVLFHAIRANSPCRIYICIQFGC